jgi:hypothetical protein
MGARFGMLWLLKNKIKQFGALFDTVALLSKRSWCIIGSSFIRRNKANDTMLCVLEKYLVAECVRQDI